MSMRAAIAVLLCAVTCLLACLTLEGEAHASPSNLPMPRFTFDTHWLKLPADLATGEIVAVAVDRRDQLWVLHRPKTVSGPISAAPPVMVFDAQGRYLRGFGGPGDGYQWPDVEHSLAVTSRGHAWVGGSFRGARGRGDDMLLEFDASGSFVRQIGRKSASDGNFDMANVRAPGDIFFDEDKQEIYVADGYGNQRVVAIDEHSGAFRRVWGAFGKPPPRVSPANPLVPLEAKDFHSFIGVHGVELSRDGLVYVSDRGNRRIQVFSRQGRFLQQVAVGQDSPAPLTASGMTFSRDRGQQYLFVADFGNGRIEVIDRRRMRLIGTIGRAGTAPGEFRGPHLMDSDSKGVLYVAEVQGRRLQRLIPKP